MKFVLKKVIYQYARIINIEKIEAFLQSLYQFDWSTIQPSDQIKLSFGSN